MVGAVFSGVVALFAVVTSPQLLDIVWCSAVAVVDCRHSCQKGCPNHPILRTGSGTSFTRAVQTISYFAQGLT